MKVLVILCGILAAVLAVEQDVFKMPQEIIDKVKKNALPCAEENNFDASIILKVADGTVPDNEAGRKFIYCFTKNAGYITDDGHIVVDKLASILRDHPLQDKFREALNKCNEITKESPLATVMAMHKCFAERPPVRLVF